MNRHCNFLGFVALALVAATPILAQTVPVAPASTATNAAASIPDFSGMWNHPAFPWFEPPAFGPGPVTNKVRLAPGVRFAARGRHIGTASAQGRGRHQRL
jgi:hypothetical protein